MYNLEVSDHSGIQVTANHFGANYLTHIDQLGIEHGYDTVLANLNVSTLRFPGGTVTETAFDVRDWDATSSNRQDGTPLTPVSEYLDFINDQNLSSSFVLPTRNLFIGELDASRSELRAFDVSQIEATLSFVRKLLSRSDSDLPSANITAIELGNEYWGSGNMTSAEYGALVNYLVPEIQKVIDELKLEGDLVTGMAEPDIIVQVGQPWGAEFKPGGYLENTVSAEGEGAEQPWSWDDKLSYTNELITSQLSDAAKGAIDGLVQHYYFRNNSGDGSRFGGQPFETSSMAKNFASWTLIAGLEDLDFHITEWNVFRHAYDQVGMQGASNNLQQFEYMLRAGVDSAQIWAVQHNTTTNLYDEVAMHTVQGEVFALMSEVLVGGVLVDDNYFGEEFEISVFENGSNTYIYVSLRSDEEQVFDLNIDALIGENHHFSEDYEISGTLVGVDVESSDGMHFVQGQGLTATQIYNEHDVAAVVTHYDAGELLSSEGNVSINFNPYEVLRIDIVDIREALSLDGTAQSETLLGSSGDDIVSGFEGNDFIDVLAGDDRLDGGAGIDRLLGGAGEDVFIFNENTGLEIVYDFEDGSDQIALVGLTLEDFDSVEISAFGSLGTIIQVGNDRMILRGTDVDDITVDDFIFEETTFLI
ncbi:hypothetical protein CLV80_12024 [Yoonia maritima]|uniref:Hemolysin type calcium-binding protein n=1 Tax=Yoonia maritima TaxID=1435347 RepID=A0A2T0VTA7_9RHOB|nr:hypothetical protein [Yoonia maritima]PRY74246.1 hypothetical protein CLV80_12024 [Yoonia maritima]